MRRKVLVEGPILTQSGYGEHARLVLRALKQREDVLDIYISPLNWGSTSWIIKDSEENEWLKSLMAKDSNGAKFDIHIHVGIPNEFTAKAPHSVCVTAGIETTKVSPSWIQKTHEMSQLIVPSEFSKWVFENTKYDMQDQQGQTMNVGCGAPVKVVHYPVTSLEKDDNFSIELENDFNFLMVAQWGIRKNIPSTIQWFIEEFGNEDVGLVIKSNTAKNSYMDRMNTKGNLESILEQLDYENKKCSVYLLHGDLTREEMNSLYTHPKIKAFVSATHGEGYGLPIFEAALNELPVVAPGWSGHLDFLYGDIRDKKGKVKKKPLFLRVDYNLAHVPKEAVWKDIIVQDSMWCYPNPSDFKRKIRNVYKDNGMYKSWAKKLKKTIVQNHDLSKIKNKMLEALVPSGILKDPEYIYVSDMFASQYAGGAELSMQAIMEKSPVKDVGAVNSQLLSTDIIKKHKKAKWVFGNIANMPSEIFEAVQRYELEYTFIEFDYKFCKHRNPVLYEMVEGEACNYSETEQGTRLCQFMNGAKSVFFMSENQLNIHKESLKDLKHDHLKVLSSIFSDDFYPYIENIKNVYKNKKKTKWLVMGSNSWVKGVQESEDWCKENNLDYEIIQGLTPEKFLEKLAQAKGLCFKPSGLDTCPRLVIEAKLLGCELSLNENVQHSEEPWFTGTDEEMIDYLKGRTQAFWELAFE